MRLLELIFVGAIRSNKCRGSSPRLPPYSEMMRTGLRRRRSRPTAPASTREAAEVELGEVEVKEASTDLLGDEEMDEEEAEAELDRAEI